jgi:hypothetical protein
MQIPSSSNLPIITGYSPQTPARPSPSPPPANSAANQTATSQPTGQAVAALQRVRPTIQVQPLYDQSLTYRGEQARRTYQNVEMGGEVELMHRLDETA